MLLLPTCRYGDCLSAAGWESVLELVVVLYRCGALPDSFCAALAGDGEGGLVGGGGCARCGGIVLMRVRVDVVCVHTRACTHAVALAWGSMYGHDARTGMHLCMRTELCMHTEMRMHAETCMHKHAHMAVSACTKAGCGLPTFGHTHTRPGMPFARMYQ